LIKDEALRQAVELQIAHFGQIPQQLFRTPHPARQSSVSRSSTTLPRALRKCFLASVATVSSQMPPPSLSASPYQGSRAASVDISAAAASSSLSNQFTSPIRGAITVDAITSQFAASATDEEEIASICKCSMINRRNPGLTLRRSAAATNDQGILGRRPSISEPSASARPQRAQTSGVSGLAVGNILTFMISTERILAVIDSGVVEVYKCVSFLHCHFQSINHHIVIIY